VASTAPQPSSARASAPAVRQFFHLRHGRPPRGVVPVEIGNERIFQQFAGTKILQPPSWINHLCITFEMALFTMASLFNGLSFTDW
jgi:hypothetical protein